MALSRSGVQKTDDTTWTSFKTVSTIDQCDTVLTFNPRIRNPTFTEMLPTQRDYESLHEHRHVKDSESEWYAVTQSLSETCGTRNQSATPLLFTFHTYPGTEGKYLQFVKKKYYKFAVLKHQKRRVSLKNQSQYCTYSIGGLNWWMRTA